MRRLPPSSTSFAAGGIRSFEHWLAIECGFDPHTGRELLRVGKALRGLPRIAAAFAAGQLSFDKVREVTTVAGPETDELMLEIARGASGSQLARVCRSLRRMTAPGSHQQQAMRGLWMRFDDDGMMRLVANLSPEDGAIVQAAIESVSAKLPLPADADDAHAARRVDALVAACDGGAPGKQVVVHVDVGVLSGETSDGVCNLENGGRLTAEAARRIGCDAEILPVVERDGLPIDVGRRFRTAPPKLRRALEIRDRFCRFPGCSVPARMTDAHHHDPWFFGGGTNLRDMLLLCRFHHRTYHEGGYRIVRTDGNFRFEADDGHVIGEQREIAVTEARDFPAETARAGWGGERMDLDHTLFVLGQYFGPTGPRAGPNWPPAPLPGPGPYLSPALPR